MTSNTSKDPRQSSPGLVGGIVISVFKVIGWLLLSLMLSIALEWIGMIWWWPDEGAQHSLDMYAAEIRHLGGSYNRSLLTDNPEAYAASMTEFQYHWMWQKTYAINVIEWMANPPAADASVVRRGLYQLTEYAVAAVNITQVFTLRIAILTLAMPVFVLFGLVGLTDGLVQRDIRKWGGGRESSYIFHWAMKMIGPIFVLTWLIYLSMPFPIDPGLVVLPFATIFAMTLRVSATTFKKYL